MKLTLTVRMRSALAIQVIEDINRCRMNNLRLIRPLEKKEAIFSSPKMNEETTRSRRTSKSSHWIFQSATFTI
jgi:hypothetical protein